jgi:flagellar hook-associated protein 3 FlgL
MNMPGDRIFLGQSVAVPKAAGSSESEGYDLHLTNEGLSVNGRPVRGPSSLTERTIAREVDGQGDSPAVEPNVAEAWQKKGTNVFNVLKDLEISLKTNDKSGIQESLDRLDEALSQVVIARSELGSRAATLNSATDSLQKGQIDAKTLASNLEDADTFQLVSDINQTESTLKASLATSGKLIQPSLLDFLK